MRRLTAPQRSVAPRILIVDENRNGLLARKSVLEDEGYEVEAHTVTNEAFAAFDRGNFQLVITDYQSSGATACELIGYVREARPDVPIIVLSAMVEALGLDKKSTRADAVISKSATELNHLLRAVKRLLNIPLRKPAAKQGIRRTRKTSNS